MKVIIPDINGLMSESESNTLKLKEKLNYFVFYK